MTGYLDLAGLKARTLAPASYVDEIEAAESGWIDEQLEIWSRWIDAQLRKRYVTPFTNTIPDAILVWLAAIMDPKIYLKRGVDAGDQQFTEIVNLANKAIAEIHEAADAKDGLFDLPLHEGATADGISKGAPLGYTEHSPYTWSPLQRDDADDDLTP
jgi:hypothetical protein